MTSLENCHSIEAIQTEIGRRLYRTRLNQNISQADLAREAGVSKRTVLRLEQGKSVQLNNFLRVIKALGLNQNFEFLVPDPLDSPIQFLALQGKQRKRASSSRSAKETQEEWSWGEDE